MEFLKELLGDELYQQVSEKLKGSQIKLADLSKGEYVGIGKLTAAETKATDLEKQLQEASKQIEAFKEMDIDGIKKAADEWRDTAAKAKKEADDKISIMQFNHALERELLNARVRDPKVIEPLLKRDKLKYSEESIVGLKEQLEQLSQSHNYLFDIEQHAQQPAQQQLPNGTKLFQPDSSKAANGGEKNPWTKEYYSLAEQTRIYREDPTKAVKMAAAAGKEI